MSTTTRHLVLALLCALTLTPWGAAAAVVLVVVTAVRLWPGQTGSPTGARVLSVPQYADALDPTGGRGQAMAGADQAVVHPR